MLPKYYRKVDELKRERTNYEKWLQGVYIYEAMVQVSPVLNALSAKKKPFPYRDMPIPITEIESKRQKEIEKEKQMKKGLEAMRIMAAEFNANFNKINQKGGNDNGN